MSHYNTAYMASHTACMSCGRAGDDWHHAVYRRMKSVPQLNEPENLLLLCKACHAEFHETGYSGRCLAWLMKCQEFGLEHMTRWHDELPMKTKERFE